MKLLFIGIQPGVALKSALLSSGSTVDQLPVKEFKEKAPSPRRPAYYDLIVFQPGRIEDLPILKGLRKRFSQAWISVIIGKAWLSKPNAYHGLMESPDKHDVWMEDSWESLFWYGLQRATRHKDLLGRLKEKDIEIKRLTELYDQLSISSGQMIRKLEKNVDLASDIQRSLLPKFSPKIPGISVAVKFVPAAGAGGDYYDIFELGDKSKYGVIMADSKTHGMAAALLSVLVKVKLAELKDRFPNSNSFMDYLNSEIRKIPNKNLAPLSLLFGILDRSELQFNVTIAGGIRPLLWRDGAAVSIKINPNPPLGDMAHYEFRETQVSLRPGDLLLMYTDGLHKPLLTDKKQKDVETAIVEILKSKGDHPDPLDLQNEFMSRVDHFLETEALPDDLTMIHFAISSRALYVAKKPEKDQSK